MIPARRPIFDDKFSQMFAGLNSDMCMISSLVRNIKAQTTALNRAIT